MKRKLFTAVLVSILSVCAMSASQYQEDAAMSASTPKMSSFRPNQVIVKYKDNSSLTVRRAPSGRLQASASVVDSVFSRLGVNEMEQLMPLTGHKCVSAPQRVRSITGKMIGDADLSKLYVVRYDSTSRVSVNEAVKLLESLPDVEFAEPNYLVYAQTLPSDTFLLEPFVNAQWGLDRLNLPAMWNVPKTGTKRPVIAIIDTGVQTDHPDLAANMWVNEAELNGLPGVDDDMNGLIDDVNGYDFVNQTGRVGDWNGHGTHCAGIAAAVGNNNIGITGANPDALIMAITVLQSDGIGDMATIIRGIDYASDNGADILSMSLGGYGTPSNAEEFALAKAYQHAIIVAAAGNDGLDITRGHLNAFGQFGAPMFPGAFTFVLGTQASQAYPVGINGCVSTGRAFNPWRADFSNFDCDDYFSEYDEEKIYNYEIMAPGAFIYSTYPGGRYKYLQGTSMATPFAAGAISRLIQCKDYVSNEQLFGDLIHTAGPTGDLDVYAAYLVQDSMRKPMMEVVSIAMTDSAGDNDGRYDAGEDILLYPVLRNTWGNAQNIKVWVTVAENEDTLIATFPDTVPVDFGRTLGCYGKAKSVNPVRMHINDSCVDGRHIRLQVHMTCDNQGEKFYNDKFTILVESGEELNGILDRNTTLDPTKHYLVNRSLGIPEGITLTIPAGTTIKMRDGVQIVCYGRIRSNGTAENPVVFTKGDLDVGVIAPFVLNNNCIFTYTQFKDIGCGTGYYNLFTSGKFTDCIWDNCYMGFWGMTGVNTTRCNIVNCMGYLGFDYDNSHKNTNIIENKTDNLDPFFGYQPSFNTKWEDLQACNVFANFSEYMGCYADLNCVVSEPTVRYNDYPSYVGTTNPDRARERIMDFYHVNNDVYYHSFGSINLSNMLQQPSPLAHGIVWKIEVDSFDVQDEKDSLPPLSIGRHRFDVYFNRAMNPQDTPSVAMGVRPPYVQVSIGADGTWNDDYTIYTAYLDIDERSYFDGINRISVMGAVDNEYFSCPVERTRFEVEVQMAGSKSIGFEAVPGMGEVSLCWKATDSTDLVDLMGYALYRYTLNDSLMPSDTIRVNEQLIEDTVYTDYDVVPGTTYFYYYKPIRSDFSDVTPSQVVAATPLTAQKGDANGSMNVDVADVVAEIAYLTNENPKPFIFEAADVNSDLTIDILDVVGTINMILSPGNTAQVQGVPGSARYYIEDGVLYVSSEKAIAGVQVMITANPQTTFIASSELEGFERMGMWKDEATYQFLAFSLAGKCLEVGTHALLTIEEGAEIADIILSDSRGCRIVCISEEAGDIGQIESIELKQPYPNPFTSEVKIAYAIGQTDVHETVIRITDVSGRLVASFAAESAYGMHTITWHAEQAMSGVYFVSLYADGKHIQTSKVIKQ